MATAGLPTAEKERIRHLFAALEGLYRATARTALRPEDRFGVRPEPGGQTWWCMPGSPAWDSRVWVALAGPEALLQLDLLAEGYPAFAELVRLQGFLVLLEDEPELPEVFRPLLPGRALRRASLAPLVLRPGHALSLPRDEETALFTRVLEQATEVACRCAWTRGPVQPGAGGALLVREEVGGEWRDTRVCPDRATTPHLPPPAPAPLPEPSLLAQARQARRSRERWLILAGWTPSLPSKLPILGEPLPVAVDVVALRGPEWSFRARVVRKREPLSVAVPAALLETVLRREVLPASLLVLDDGLRRFLSPLATALEVPLEDGRREAAAAQASLFARSILQHAADEPPGDEDPEQEKEEREAGDTRSLLVQARRAWREDRPYAAERLCRQALEEDPEALQALLDLAVILDGHGRAAEALRLLERPRRPFRRDPEVAEIRCEMHLARVHLREAREALAVVHRGLEGTSPDLLVDKARLARALGYHREAADLLHRLRMGFPTHAAVAATELGLLRLAEGRPGEAVEVLQEVPREGSRGVATAPVRVLAWRHAGQESRARETLAALAEEVAGADECTPAPAPGLPALLATWEDLGRLATELPAWAGPEPPWCAIHQLLAEALETREQAEREALVAAALARCPEARPPAPGEDLDQEQRWALLLRSLLRAGPPGTGTGDAERRLQALEPVLALDCNRRTGILPMVAAARLRLGQGRDWLEGAPRDTEAFAVHLAWCRALATFQRDGTGARSARFQLWEAFCWNPFVATGLLAPEPPACPATRARPGSPQEAEGIVAELLAAWQGTPGAVPWLRQELALP